MEFRTVVNPPQSNLPIGYESRVMMFGSCFSDSISTRLNNLFFSVLANPLGTLYNPASIADTIERIGDSRVLSTDELFESEGRFHSFACHSSLSMSDRENTLTNINERILSANAFLKNATHLYLTFGTAWVYSLDCDGSVVANCHKQPAAMFKRSMLSVERASDEIRRAISAARKLNPDIAVRLTVSPIRHLADGAHGNSLSKSTLQLACNEVCRTDNTTEYFPAYEIMLDDLRDYRFYGADMCHPSEIAADYIFEKFSETYFTKSTQAIASRCHKLRNRLEHRHLTSDPKIISRFNQSTAGLARQLISECSALQSRLESEIKNLK